MCKYQIIAALLILGVIVVAISGCASQELSANGVKIFLGEDGIYKVDAETLAQSGLHLDGIDLRRLRLSNRGENQSLFVFEDAGSIWIEFYGRESESQYSAENIYILEILDRENDHTFLVNKEVTNTPSPNEAINSTYYETMMFEDNQLYFPQVNGRDNWYWVTVSSGQSQIFPFKVSELMPEEGYIRLDFWSNTESPANPDHHLLLKINEHTVLDMSWDGRGGHVFNASIPDGVLVEGDNQVVIEIPGDTQAIAEVYWVNWFEVTYPRRAVAELDRLKFIASGQPLLFSGFRDQVQIFDITGGNEILPRTITVESENNVIFNGIEGHSYYAVGKDGLRDPLSVVPLVSFQDLGAKVIGADYLAIGQEEYLAAAANLFSHREAQGLKVMQIPLQAIYDQYNFGFPEPEAVRQFLAEATRMWEIVPKYVLLIGDASYDPKNFLQQPVTNILPSFFVQTIYGGQTVSDIPFADVDVDGIPDIAVGRIPASTSDEVAIAVKKILEFENASYSLDSTIRILAIADGQEAGFRIDAQHFLDIFPLDANRILFNPSTGTPDANVNIQSYFNDGYTYIAYFGHGSVVMWGKDQLFSVEDATALVNDRYPVIINMTCLTGLFTHPKTESLTEALIFNPSGGAVAILAPTSLTLSGEQNQLSTPLAETIRNDSLERLGDVYLTAQQKMAQDTPGVRDVLETFLLFGDPGLIVEHNR